MFGVGANGVSIFFPKDMQTLKGQSSVGVRGDRVYRNYINQCNTPANLAFCTDTRWDEFLRAYIEPNYTLALTIVIDNPNWATVIVEPNLSEYTPNTVVTLTAEPNEGIHFEGWTIYDICYPGDVNYATFDANLSTTLVMERNHEVTAAFAERFILTLGVINGFWGTVSVDPNQPFYQDNQVVTLTATPDEGRGFGEWTIYDPNYPDDVNHAIYDSNATTTIVMNSNMHVSAHFSCSTGVGPVLPGMLGTLVLVVFVRHRRR
jgi:hypothetical protein